MSFIIKQPIEGGMQPYAGAQFGSEEAAETYKIKVIQKLKNYLAIRLAGTPVGKKEPADLELEILQANAWEVVEA